MDNFILFLYNFILHFLALTLLPVLMLITPMIKRFRLGFLNYFGRFGKKQAEFINSCKAAKRDIYLIHGVSVGEVKLARFVMDEILKTSPDAAFVITSTSLESVGEAERFSAHYRSISIFFPLDIPIFVSNFLKELKPEAIFVLEVDLWPNFIIAGARMQVPFYLLNGRVSNKTLSFYSKIPSFTKSLLSLIDFFFMQSAHDAEMIIQLGADPKNVAVCGNMKFDLAKSPADRDKIVEINDAIAASFGRTYDFTLCAGSTHENEEEIVANSLISASGPGGINALLIIAPRKIERAEAILKKIKERGIRAARFSAPLTPGAPCIKHEPSLPDALIIDRMGYLASAYSLADAAFVGGTLSLKDVGGHNVIEPAAFGIPVIAGENVRNFKDVARELEKSGGFFKVANEEELKNKLTEFLSGRNQYALSCGARSLIEIVAQNSNVTEKIFTRIRGV